jgi:hypothetical protein
VLIQYNTQKCIKLTKRQYIDKRNLANFRNMTHKKKESQKAASLLTFTIEESSKKLVSNNSSSPGIIPHPGIVPHPFEGFETIIPHGELKRETR